jgi:hypothetical protein
MGREALASLGYGPRERREILSGPLRDLRHLGEYRIVGKRLCPINNSIRVIGNCLCCIECLANKVVESSKFTR